MIQLADNLWIGNSDDDRNFLGGKIGGVLNVAQDLRGKYGWPNVEYMQVGLIDGPGNEMVWYCSAVLSLVSLAIRHKCVAVYDHDGSRAVVVALMYLNLVRGKYRANPLSWSHWLTWEERLRTVEDDAKMLLPRPHAAHLKAFSKIPFGLLEAFL